MSKLKMFSWGRPSAVPDPPTSNYPGQVQAQTISQPYSREEHLQSYLTDPTLRPSTRRVSGDDTTYDTVFQTKSGHAIILRVHLPGQTSSYSRPAMTLVGVKATHLWLDRKMRIVGFSPILNDEQWAQSRLKLGDAVNKVVKHLQLQPPNVIEITDESLKRLQASLPKRQSGTSHQLANSDRTSNGVFVPDNYASASEPAAPVPINLPPVPRSFPELETLSKEKMRELLDNETALKDYVDQMSTVETVKDLMGSIFDGNVETSKGNVEKQEELEILHAECQALRNDLREKIASFQVLETKQQEICKPTDTLTAISQLKKGKKQLFDESEDLASRWTNDESDMNIEQFVESFMELRILHHERAAKIERLQHSS